MKPKVLFIHNPRTAGTSIQRSGICFGTRFGGLKPAIRKQMDLDPNAPMIMGPIMQRAAEKHIPYHFLDKSFTDRYDKVFTIVRNPWAKLVSLFEHGHRLFDRTVNTPYHQPIIEWDDFINNIDTFIMTSNFYWNHAYDQQASQHNWLNPKYVDVLRYENLQADLNDYFDSEICLGSENSSSTKRHYTEYYTREQRNKVAENFWLDINYFGFTFESGATQNYWKKQ